MRGQWDRSVVALRSVRSSSASGIPKQSGLKQSSNNSARAVVSLKWKNGPSPPSACLNTCKAQAAIDRPALALRKSLDSSEAVEVLHVNGIPGVQMELIRLTKPRSANDSSILVRATHRGISRLYTGDLEISGMRTLLDEAIDLRADILKHPHHVSLRKNLSPLDRKTLKEFVQEVGPHTVLPSNRGSGQNDATEAALRTFYREVLNRPGLPLVRMKATNDVSENGIEIPGATRGLTNDVDSRPLPFQIGSGLRFFRLM